MNNKFSVESSANFISNSPLVISPYKKKMTLVSNVGVVNITDKQSPGKGEKRKSDVVEEPTDNVIKNIKKRKGKKKGTLTVEEELNTSNIQVKAENQNEGTKQKKREKVLVKQENETEDEGTKKKKKKKLVKQENGTESENEGTKQNRKNDLVKQENQPEAEKGMWLEDDSESNDDKNESDDLGSESKDDKNESDDWGNESKDEESESDAEVYRPTACDPREKHMMERKSIMEKENLNNLENTARSILVSNLPSVSIEEVKSKFSVFGKVEYAHFRPFSTPDARMPQRFAAFRKNPMKRWLKAFLRFESISSVLPSLQLNNFIWKGRTLHVVRLCSPHNLTNCVFVGNIHFRVEEDELKRVFADCGLIHGVHLIRDNRTGLGKGFAYVYFENTDAVKLALDKSGYLLRDRQLHVHPAVKKLKGTSFRDKIRQIGFRKGPVPPHSRQKNYQVETTGYPGNAEKNRDAVKLAPDKSGYLPRDRQLHVHPAVKKLKETSFREKIRQSGFRKGPVPSHSRQKNYQVETTGNPEKDDLKDSISGDDIHTGGPVFKRKRSKSL